MKRSVFTFLTIAFSIMASAPADAGESACAAVLATREVYEMSEQSLLLDALAVYTDEKTLKKSSERLKIGIPEVISADGAGWRKSKERARRGETRFRNESHARSYLFEGPARGAVEAWSECMEAEQDGPTFFAYLAGQATSQSHVVVTLFWSKGPHDPSSFKLVTKPPEVDVSRLIPGKTTFALRRPTVQAGPSDVVFGGRYSTSFFSSAGDSTVLTILPPNQGDAQGGPEREVRIQASRIASQGRCDKEYRKNEYRIRVLVNEAPLHGPVVVPVRNNGSATFAIDRTVKVEGAAILSLEASEQDHGNVNSTVGRGAVILDFSKPPPIVISLSASARAPEAGTCTATVDFTVSWENSEH